MVDHKEVESDFRSAVTAAKRWADIVPLYRGAIRGHTRDMGEDSVWPVIHRQILARWSKRTLESIKREAWKAFK